jgi:hypothetical protein
MTTEDQGIKTTQCEKLLDELNSLGISAQELYAFACAKDLIQESKDQADDPDEDSEKLSPQDLCEANLLAELDDSRETIIDFWTDVAYALEAITGEQPTPEMRR